MKKILFAATLLACFAGSTSAQVLLEVDLSVPDTITVRATSANSAATVSGADDDGVYLAGFFAADGTDTVTDTLVSSNLSSAANPPDSGSANLYRGDTYERGLNIYNLSTDTDLDFSAGTLAFTGSATWTINTDLYNEMLLSPGSGDLYFPADNDIDIPGATRIGRWIVVPQASSSQSIPALPPAALLILVFAVLFLGWRAQHNRP